MTQWPHVLQKDVLCAKVEGNDKHSEATDVTQHLLFPLGARTRRVTTMATIVQHRHQFN